MRRFLVSCTNDADHGGIYLCDSLSNKVERVYQHQCMGMTLFRGYYIIASQSTNIERGNAHLHENKDLKLYVPHSIVCLDRSFKVVSEALVHQLGMGDLHDIILLDDKLWVVDTFGNRVVVFKIYEHYTIGCLPLASWFIQPVLEWVDPVAQEPDASHVNSLCFIYDHVWVATFGRFRIHRGYELRGDEGCIMDITGHFRTFGCSASIQPPLIVKDNLADPHTLLFHEGQLFLTEARKSRVIKEWHLFLKLDYGYARGLMFDENSLWVGYSQSRHSSSIINSCRAVQVSLSTKKILNSIRLPAREIYAFLPIQDKD